MGAREELEHVIVLMLENRSFDGMLGKLYPADRSFAGLTGAEGNPYNGVPLPVWNDTGMTPDTACIPDPDPGELFPDMTAQLFGAGGRPGAAPPPMDGFVANYMAQPAGGGPARDPKAVMHYFTPEQVPVISTLARAFGVCDQWHAAAPCQTWPNRFFAHTGTAQGWVDNGHFPIPFPAPSIFRRLEDRGKSWRVYFHDMPQSLLLRDIWLLAPLRYRPFAEFLDDAQNGALPNYTFIEPRYFTDVLGGNMPNDGHPPHNVAYEEQLIAAVYNAVRASSCWKKTLLVITYDEHGGCYDHVPPPLAMPPDAHAQDGFAFDRYGVRVPAVIVSPYMPPGSIVRVAPDGLPHQGPPYPFDHTSILATLRQLFDLGPPLTGRDAAAPDLLDPLSLNDPTNDGPSSVTPPTGSPTTTELQQRAAAPANHMQAALSRAAVQLGATPPTAPADVPAPSPQGGNPTFAEGALAARDVIDRVAAFLGL
jgi:phospholipase C